MNRACPISVLALIFAAVCMFGVSAASAQSDPSAKDDPCPTPRVRTDVRPNADGPPVGVSVGVRMLDLREISDVDQTMTVDLAVLRTWTDPRLAHMEGCAIPVNEVWFPDLIVKNSGRLFERWPRDVTIGPNGEVKYLQRYFGTIASYHSLHDFPFDKQVIKIQFFPLLVSEQEVLLTVDEKFTGMDDLLNISDWNIETVEGDINRRHMPAYNRFHSSYELLITASRIRGYYVWKIILPLCLIVAMSWCVFWINPSEFGTQIGLSATAMLTLIAFIFATTNMVPALGYFTLLDFFIGGSTILVFLALLQSLLTSYLVTQDKSNLAMRIDRLCRILFPLSFATMAAGVFIR